MRTAVRLRSWASARRAAATAGGGDAGNAVVEFLGVALLLLVPTVYLVLVVGRLQAASFAAEGAAREAARVLASADAPATNGTADARTIAVARARAVVQLAFADQGFHDVDAARALRFACSTVECDPGTDDVTVHVEVDVSLPGIPAFVQGAVPLAVGVSAEAIAPLAPYRGLGS